MQLPEAVITLKQGIGFRDQNDKGVLIICDNRFVARPMVASFYRVYPRYQEPET